MKPNSHNLVMSAMFGGRRGPRPAAGNPTSIACHGLMDKAGVSFPEAHLNADAIIGKVMGPWTMSYHMIGTQNFLLAAGLGESAKVSAMLRQLMPVTIAFINAQLAAGADIVVLADHATRNLVGPYHYEQYLLPIHQEIRVQGVHRNSCNAASSLNL